MASAQESAQLMAELEKFCRERHLPLQHDQNLPGGRWRVSVGSPDSDLSQPVRTGSRGWGG